MFFLPAIIEVDRSFNSSMIFLSASFENFPLISFPNLHFLAFLHPSVYLLLVTHLTLLFFPSTYPSPYILPSPFSGISLAWSSLIFPSFHLLLTSLTPSFHFQILLTPSSPPFLTAPSLILSLFLNHPPPLFPPSTTRVPDLSSYKQTSKGGVNTHTQLRTHTNTTWAKSAVWASECRSQVWRDRQTSFSTVCPLPWRLGGDMKVLIDCRRS